MNREERLHTAVLVAPASERRKTRKQRRAAAARIAAAGRASIVRGGHSYADRAREIIDALD